MDLRDEFAMRVSAKTVDKNPVHSRLSVWVNGGLITSPGGICLRNEEVDEFLRRLRNGNPDESDADALMAGVR